MTKLVRLLLTSLIVITAVVLGLMGYLTEEPEAIIQWSTESEVETAGFHVYRATSEAGPYERVTGALIPSSGDPFSGAEYEFRDADIEPGTTYYYQLEELETNGNFTRLPETVSFEAQGGPLAMFSYLNWGVVTILLGALLIVWLLPSRPRKEESPDRLGSVEV
ncbi:MAG: hypothetical protein M3220_06185 [Chloroflexota bacterium]|nr:hypothetical protein [Chloroflexota bacterium]